MRMHLLLLLLSVFTIGCSNSDIIGPNSNPDMNNPDSNFVVAYAEPSPTSTPEPSPEPTEEPIRRNRPTPTPEPVNEPEPEPIVVNRADPSPTPWLSCDNPDFQPPNLDVRAETSINEVSLTVHRLVALTTYGELPGGIPKPWVGAGTILTYPRTSAAYPIHFTWTYVASIAGGQLICTTIKDVYLEVPGAN